MKNTYRMVQAAAEHKLAVAGQSAVQKKGEPVGGSAARTEGHKMVELREVCQVVVVELQGLVVELQELVVVEVQVETVVAVVGWENPKIDCYFVVAQVVEVAQIDLNSNLEAVRQIAVAELQ